jgi:hypothetical protein
MFIPVSGLDDEVPDAIRDLVEHYRFAPPRVPFGPRRAFPLIVRDAGVGPEAGTVRWDEGSPDQPDVARVAPPLFPMEVAAEPEAGIVTPQRGGPAESVRPAQLERWAIQAREYTAGGTGKVSLFGRLFGGHADMVKAGVVHEAKRFTLVRDTYGNQAELGVAVRIVAGTSEWQASVQLTLPNVAADAQLHSRDARVSMEVVGYAGALGALLPAPQRLDVSSLAEYLSAFRSIQAEVFGERGLACLAPTLLGYEAAPLSDHPPAAAG